MTRKEYAGIDLFKLIFSFFVIFIHCHPEGTVPFLIANGVGRLAVPFFFVAAGYFLGKNHKLLKKDWILKLTNNHAYWSK